jgi:CHASE3 domain sensor protein
MRNRRFMLYLLGIFITVILLIVFLQYSSNSNINKLIEGNESLIREFKIIGETQKLETDMLYIETHIYRTVFTEDSSFLEGIQAREKSVKAGLLKLQPLVLTDSTKKLVQKLDSLIEKKLEVGNNVLNTLFTKGQSAAIGLYMTMKKKYIMGEIVQVIDSLNKPRQQYLTKLAVEANNSGKKARQWGIVLAITAVLADIFAFGYITKRFKRQQHL